MTEPVNPFPVVGVGASAGGLDALTRLVRVVPADSGLAVVIVQHLDPHHESQLSTILASETSSSVVDAAHGMKVQPDHIYVIRPNTNVAIADGVLSVTPRPDDRRPHYPVDHFLRSLAAVQGPHAVGVVLSGTGSDGTLGLSEIKAAGGVTFAQDERTAQHAGMPQSAIASGAVDLVLSPEDIAARLLTLPSHPYLRPTEPAEQREDTEKEDFHRIVDALRRSSGVDFSQYRDTTLKRRTARRMLLRGFKTAEDYAQFVERDVAEANALYRDVLINVTSFFREPEMFEELRHRVFPEILKDKGSEPIRVWVPGCSTGQEAYPLRWYSSSSSAIAMFSATFRSLRPTWAILPPWNGPAAASIPKTSSPKSALSDCSDSSPRRIARTGSRRAFAISVCLPGRISLSIRHSRE